MSVDADLATLRGFSGPDLAPGYDAALDRLEAKVATLRKERDAARKQSRESSGMYVQANEQITELLQQQSFMERKLVAQRGDIERLAERVMAAEARCARLESELRSAMDSNAALQQALVDLHESLFIGSEDGLSKDTLREMAAFAKREVLAGQPAAAEGPDTPADNQEDKT